jgi:hypothetical protein
MFKYLAAFCCCAVLFAAPLYAEGAETKPQPQNWTLGLSVRYNQAYFQTNGVYLNSNAPVFLGGSFAWKGWGLSFSIAQTYTYTPTPGKHTAIDAGMTFEQGQWQEEASVKYYDDMLQADSKIPVDYALFLVSLGGAYYFNPAFSAQAAYKMRGQQETSAGSWIALSRIGFKNEKSDTISRLSPAQDSLTLDAGCGYSYTFAFKSGFYINATLKASLGAGLVWQKPSPVFTISAAPSLILGFWGKYISWNFALTVNFQGIVQQNRFNYYLFNAASPSAAIHF